MRNSAKLKYLKIISDISRIGIGSILIIASIDKIAAPGIFLDSFLEYEIITGKLAIMMASLLPWIELLLGILLVSHIIPRFSIPITILLFVIFISALAIVAIKGKSLDCGCFRFVGASTDKNPVGTIVRDVLMLLLLIYSYAYEYKISRVSQNE